MKRKNLMTGMLTVVLAGALCLGTIYTASFAGEKIRETETETETETESETENTSEEITSLLDVLINGREKSAGLAVTDDGLMYEAAEEDAMYAGGGYDWNMPQWNTEEYSTVDESGFKESRLYPFSTFGMDVDTASYALLRRNTLDDTLSWFPKDAVRIEEMINYFNYDYEAPKDGETFSVNARITACPWNPDTKLMRIGLQARDIPQEEIPEQNLVFLIDSSGSMYDADKLPLAIDALTYLLDEMDEKDRVSIVTYAGSSEILLQGEPCTEEGKEKIREMLNSIEANGGTYGEYGIRNAYDLAQETFIEGGNNRVLLLTDGDFNLGQTDDSELVKLVEEKAEGKIFLSILGFGTGNYNDKLAETLADKGNGNYSYIDSDMEARRVMGGALKGTLNTVAKDAKVQVDFNADQVKGYRLVGYENRKMDAEDFEDDTKDGGEVGAGQQVTVLYELVMKDSPMEIRTVHSRYEKENAEGTDAAADTAGQTEADGEVRLAIASETETEIAAAGPSGEEYLTVSIRWKDPDAEKSQLMEYPVDASAEAEEMDDDMSWAAGMAQAGMLIRGSEFAGTSDWDEIKDRLSALTDGDEFREEFVYLLNRLKGAELGADIVEYDDYDYDDYEMMYDS